MDKEIKILISKRSLTFYTISVLVILLSFFLGYSIRGISAQQESAKTTIAITRSNTDIARISNSEFTTDTIETTPETHREVVSQTTSDPSWSLKVSEYTPKAPPAEESVRYYATNTQTSNAQSTIESNDISTTDSQYNKYVASKNGTKYYPVDCKSADRIKEENRIYFASAEEAELEGLSRTTTCK